MTKGEGRWLRHLSGSQRTNDLTSRDTNSGGEALTSGDQNRSVQPQLRPAVTSFPFKQQQLGSNPGPPVKSR